MVRRIIAPAMTSDIRRRTAHPSLATCEMPEDSNTTRTSHYMLAAYKRRVQRHSAPRCHRAQARRLTRVFHTAMPPAEHGWRKWAMSQVDVNARSPAAPRALETAIARCDRQVMRREVTTPLLTRCATHRAVSLTSSPEHCDTHRDRGNNLGVRRAPSRPTGSASNQESTSR